MNAPETCNARFLESEAVFCQLEANHPGEHWSRFREEGDSEDYRRAEISWVSDANAKSQRQPL